MMLMPSVPSWISCIIQTPLLRFLFYLQIIKDIDIKPSPVLWHEDNVGRGQQGRER